MRIDAHARERKFDHIRAANDCRTSRLQAGHGGTVVKCRTRGAQNRRPGRRDLATDVEQVFHRYRQTTQRLLLAGRAGGHGARLVEHGFQENMRAAGCVRGFDTRLHQVFGPGLSVTHKGPCNGKVWQAWNGLVLGGRKHVQ